MEESGTVLDLNKTFRWHKRPNIRHIKVIILVESIYYNSPALLSLHYMLSLPSLTFFWSYVVNFFSKSSILAPIFAICPAAA